MLGGMAAPPHRPIPKLALALLAPPLCVLCRAPLPRPARGAGLCRSCEREIGRGEPLGLAGDGIEAGFAALPYEGAGRRLVAALKFSRLLPVAALAAALIESRAPAGVLAGEIVPVPASPLRLLTRGFDPAGELAAALAGVSGLPASAPLRRRDLRHQRGRRRAQRLRHPPRVVARGRVPSRVLLIDDVATTGATLAACAAALREGGCERVHAVALAAVRTTERTLPGAGRPP